MVIFLCFRSANNKVIIKTAAATSILALLSAVFVFFFGAKQIFFLDAYGTKKRPPEIRHRFMSLVSGGFGIKHNNSFTFM